MKKQLCLAASAALVMCGVPAAFAQHYVQTNLVANKSGVAPVTDASLVNPWGVARGSGSPWWVSDNVTGLSTLYTGAGMKQGLVVKIPPAQAKTPAGSPTGAIFNGSATDFLLAAGDPALFLFATADGTIAGWNPAVGVARGAKPPSLTAVTMVRMTDGSSYTGLTSALIGSKRYLYAANFGKGRVDVWDNRFRAVKLPPPDSGGYGDDFAYDEWGGGGGNEPFVDERLPSEFVPFNVQAIGNDIVVTYALHLEGMPVETDGPGLGYVDIYNSSGRLLRRLEHGSWLNAPWGVALAPLDFGRFSHDLLIGQFAGGGTTESSGWIAAYDLATGRFDGLLEDAKGNPLAINGVWSLSPGNVSPSNSDAAGAPAAEVYFTAGPNHANGGLFGYLTAASAELVEGNDQ